MKDNKVKLNRFYQLVSKDQNIYSGEFFGIVNAITEAKKKEEINEEQFSLLLKLLLIRKIKEESRDILNWQGVTNNNNKTTSLLINISNNKKSYV